MNNGNFNSGNSSGSPEEPLYARRMERKPFLPLLVLIMGIIGMFRPYFGIAAAILGIADRHTSRRWDGKSRAGTVLGCVSVGLCLLSTVLFVIFSLTNPAPGRTLAENVRLIDEVFSSAMRISPRLY